MSVFTHVTTFSVIHCWQCGVPFGLTADFEQRRRCDHEVFMCPSGHRNYFNAQSEAEKLRDQVAAKEREVAAQKSRVEYWVKRQQETATQVDRAVRQRNAYKGVTTRLRKKVGKGICPCCSVKFKNLATHMRTDHPNWSPDKEAVALEAKGR